MRTKSGQRESRGVEVEAVAQGCPQIPFWFGEAVPWDSSVPADYDRQDERYPDCASAALRGARIVVGYARGESDDPSHHPPDLRGIPGC
jgi:hypothetical protein